MAYADTTIYLVEQSRTQVDKLAGGDRSIGIQAVVAEELSQVQTLEGDRAHSVWGDSKLDFDLNYLHGRKVFFLKSLVTEIF